MASCSFTSDQDDESIFTTLARPTEADGSYWFFAIAADGGFTAPYDDPTIPAAFPQIGPYISNDGHVIWGFHNVIPGGPPLATPFLEFVLNSSPGKIAGTLAIVSDGVMANESYVVENEEQCPGLASAPTGTSPLTLRLAAGNSDGPSFWIPTSNTDLYEFSPNNDGTDVVTTYSTAQYEPMVVLLPTEDSAVASAAYSTTDLTAPWYVNGGDPQVSIVATFGFQDVAGTGFYDSTGGWSVGKVGWGGSWA